MTIDRKARALAAEARVAWTCWIHTTPAAYERLGRAVLVSRVEITGSQHHGATVRMQFRAEPAAAHAFATKAKAHDLQYLSPERREQGPPTPIFATPEEEIADRERTALAAEARVTELEAELTTLRGKLNKLGRPRKAAETADQQLVAHACEALKISVADLAERLGMQRNSSAMLTRRVLPTARREQIKGMIASARTASRA